MRTLKAPSAITSRLLSTLLLIAVWVSSLCLVAMPSHACCKGQQDVATTLPACCVSHAVVLPKAPPETGGAGMGAWVASASLRPLLPDWALHQERLSLAMLANRHVPDQSNRHQELSVWLN